MSASSGAYAVGVVLAAGMGTRVGADGNKAYLRVAGRSMVSWSLDALSQVPESVRRFLNFNPFTHLAVSYQEVLFRTGPFVQWPRLLAVGAAAVAMFGVGYFIFDRLRDTLPEEV